MSERTDRESRSGHIYMQTNEKQNVVIHYSRSADGDIREVERVRTGGSGAGEFSPISGQAAAPSGFESARSVILTSDRKFLFVTNGGDNTVSSLSVDEDGGLALLDVKPTGNAVVGPSGTAKSLAYAPSSRTLFVLHAFGPDHVRLMSVDRDGLLTPRVERYSVNTHDKTDRVSTMLSLSPDETILLVGTVFDQPPTANPDGSAILWLHGADGNPKSLATNAPDPDGIIAFPVGEDGALGTPTFYDAHAGSPFFIAFLHNRPDTFVVGAAVGDGVVMGTVDEAGRLSFGSVVAINTDAGKPTEMCWLSVSPDDRSIFATVFGYSYIVSYHINGNALTVAQDPASAAVPGSGKFRALNGNVTGGPTDSFLTPDGAYLYQIFGNAAKLVGYAVQPDDSLKEVTEVSIPLNSPQGLAGF
ncbi:hypothetical protein GCM10009608_46410 [Pseudonocardia alaniniphila]